MDVGAASWVRTFEWGLWTRSGTTFRPAPAPARVDSAPSGTATQITESRSSCNNALWPAMSLKPPRTMICVSDTLYALGDFTFADGQLAASPGQQRPWMAT